MVCALAFFDAVGNSKPAGFEVSGTVGMAGGLVSAAIPEGAGACRMEERDGGRIALHSFVKETASSR